MEVFTFLLYFFDIIQTIRAYIKIKKRLRHHDDKETGEKRLWRSVDDEKKDLKKVTIYLILNIISFLTVFFHLIRTDQPLLIIFYLKCLRLLKLRPVIRLFNALKQRALNFARILEMLFLYYVACHIIACSFICIAYKQPDIRDTWLRRLPVPQPTGMRPNNDFDGLSDSTIYIHALFFTVNTVSHLAVGQITAVTVEERIYNAFIILCGTFIYAFLFGNVASIMADFAPQMFFFKFHKQFEDVMSSLKKDTVSNKLIQKIKDYFDYVWANSKGISYDEILGDLPSCLNADILFARYSEAINNSIIFKDEENEIDVALTNSILTILEYRVYMNGDFIVVGGSSSMNTYIILEGEAVVFGLNEEFIAFIKSGGHYSNDLEDGDEYTYNHKRPLHIVSKGISIVGVLNVDKLKELYIAYPEFKDKMRTLNKHFVGYVQKFCRKYLKSKAVLYSANNVIRLIADHYSYSTHVAYNKVSEKCHNIDINSKDVKKYDIIVKQKEVIKRTQTLRRASVFGGRNSIDLVNATIFNENIEPEGVCSKLSFSKNSNWRRLIDFINLLNLLYIAVSIPLLISFDIKMVSYLIFLEICSLLISLGIVLINLRTPVVMRGGSTLNLKVILGYYYHNGLILDLVSLWPLNLVLGIADLVQPIWLIPPLRIIRVISVWKSMHIFGRFELYFKKYGILMHVLKSALFLCLLWHWASCLWFFTNLYINKESDYSWMEFNKLDTAPLYKQVML